MKKRILALMMAAVLTMGMSMTAFAEEGKTYSIKIEQVEGATKDHTYEAYQIFKGELAEDNKTLSNIVWGDSVDTSNGVEYNGVTYTDKEASKLAEVLENEDDAKKFATEIAKYLKKGTQQTAKKTTEEIDGKQKVYYVFKELEDGYYFIKDEDGSLDGSDDSYSRYMIQIVGSNVTVTAKADVPSTEKKVKDKNDSTGEVTDWQDSADYDIGDRITYRFSSTIVDNIADYVNGYYYTFHDTQSKGLTFIGNVSVKVYGTKYPEGKSIGFETLDLKTDDQTGITTFSVKTEDLKQVAEKGDTVVVEYDAEINEKAEIGSKGNPNDMHLEFSNNPNGGGTGKTPVDTVIVFTYQVVINKVDEKKAPLEGAKFTLTKFDGNDYVTIERYKDEVEATPIYEKDDKGNVVVDENGKKVVKSYTFSFKGLDDGQYKLVETTTPDGYNTMDPVEFKIVATHTNDDAGENALKLTDLNGNPVDGSINLGFTESTEDGSLTADVINKQGAILPSTGGIGTTIFYVIGGILVIGAGVILFTRKRMSVED